MNTFFVQYVLAYPELNILLLLENERNSLAID